MNMSIKVCVPLHASSQKHLLISTLEASPPELSRSRERGWPLAAPRVPASPRRGRGEGSLPRVPCLPRHLGARTARDQKPQVPSGLRTCPRSPFAVRY